MPRSKKKLARKQRRHNSLTVNFAAPQITLASAGVSSPTTSALATFSGNMMCTGVPSHITVGGNPITGITQVSPTVARITQSTATATLAGQAYVIGPNEPGIRTAAGGYVTAKSGTF